MKTKAFRAIQMLSLMVVLGVSSLHALTSGKLVANIPFDFMIGNTALPAGEYTVRQGPSPAVVFIQNKETYDGAMVLSFAVQDRENLGLAKLVFERTGNDHVLSQVWSGNATGREVRKPRMEGVLATQVSTSSVDIVLTPAG